MALDYKKEALPHDLNGYRGEAADNDMQAFEKLRPYPFFLYARSNLWDPTLLIAHSQAAGGGGETRLVDYNIDGGGMVFCSPIKKTQSDGADPRITVGRATHNDVVVPVSSVSSNHAKITPPTQGGLMAWSVTDLESKNGTFFGEDQMAPGSSHALADGDYLRLGGNLIAWFLYPGHLWKVLRDPAVLSKLVDL